LKNLAQLRARGIVNAVSDPGLEDLLEEEQVSFYIGYDPSFHSLQIGNLFSIITMRRLQEMGHRPVVLIGGGTGCIGDPSGRSSERNLLDANRVEANVTAIRGQLERLIDFSSRKNGALLVNNQDWLASFSLISFLREVGRHFRVGEMLAKESVKRRMEAEDGISYTEFTYQILQAYDFLHLYRTQGVRLQCGGGDQWGNILAGIDLVRKVASSQVFGMVIPLVTDAQGNKFGKSTGGSIYLDPEISSPYQMYQFLLNAEDSCVIDYLKYYTFLDLKEIADLENQLRREPEKREAQTVLSREVVRFVHGPAGLELAEKATRIFFGEVAENLRDSDLEGIFSGVPTLEVERSRLAAGVGVVELLAQIPLWKGKNDVRRSIEQRGVYLNNRPVESVDFQVDTQCLASPGSILVRKGKKNYALLKLV
jgi:tyrosyl-tRNA synthetase